MKHYIFDFDGTLVDSMNFWGQVHTNMLINNNIDCPEDYVQMITPLGNVRTGEIAIAMGVPMTIENYLDKINFEFYKGYTSHIQLKPNVKEILFKLLNNGNKVNVLTASSHLYVDPCLKKHGIFDCFDNIWSVDDFSYTKSNVELYKEIAEFLNTAIQDCVMVDDNITAIRTAKLSGMKTIGVYDSCSDNYWEEMKKYADVTIYDFSNF